MEGRGEIENRRGFRKFGRDLIYASTSLPSERARNVRDRMVIFGSMAIISARISRTGCDKVS